MQKKKIFIATTKPFSTVDAALQQYHDGRFRSLRQAAGYHSIAKSSSVDRIHGRKSKQADIDSRTKLTRGKERSLANYVRP